MRRWGLASFLCVVIAAPTALAQTADVTATTEPEPSAAPFQEIVYGAMPGGLHVTSAETLPKGVVETSLLSGFGYRKGLLGGDERFGRAIGDLAVAYGVTDMLSVGLSLDGRYDKHYGLGQPPDDGYVGDPHINVRYAAPVSTLRVGGQLGIWIPGKNAPSVAGSAISVDARAIVSLPAGPGLLSFDAGFRLDNSAKSVDSPEKLSLQDRTSLGVSNYNEAFAGAHLKIPAGDKAWVSLEGSLETFLGSPPAGQADLAEGKLLLRATATAGYRINDEWSALAFLELAKVPGILDSQVMANSIPLISYEPIITGGLGLEARFGGAKASTIAIKDCARTGTCTEVKVPITADITGTVVDSTQKPIAGATVKLTLKDSQVAPTATDDKGTYTFKNVPIGYSIGGKPTLEETGVEVAVELDKMKPGTGSIATVAQGANTVPAIVLEPALPPGVLKGGVRAVPSGKAITDATITVEPGNLKTQSTADGNFELDLAPGQYKIKVQAPGYAAQELDVTIEQNGVAIKNIELHK